MSEIVLRKKLFRRQVNYLLAQASIKDLNTQSEHIATQLLSSLWWKKCSTLGTYLSVPSQFSTREVDTRHIIREALKDECCKKVYIITEPRTQQVNVEGGPSHCEQKRTDLMVFTRVSSMEDLDALFEVGRMGFPQLRYPTESGDSPRELDLLLVPGVAFTKQCARLGRGKGWFDRLLRTPGTTSIEVAMGLAFTCQLVAEDDFPMESHDAFLDVVVTPSGNYERDRRTQFIPESTRE